MKKSRIVLVCMAVLFAWQSAACAQEPEGLIPRLMRKFRKGAPEAKPAVAQPAASANQAPVAPVTPAVKPESAVADGEPKTVVPRIAQMTKEEIIAGIVDALDGEDEIMSYIPGLTRQKKEDGTASYLYVYEGRTLELADLDEELLRSLLTRVRQTGTKINTDRIQAQLETIRQSQRLLNMQPPQPPPQPPRTTMPPQPPPQPPRAPQPPPLPPRR